MQGATELQTAGNDIPLGMYVSLGGTAPHATVNPPQNLLLLHVDRGEVELSSVVFGHGVSLADVVSLLGNPAEKREGEGSVESAESRFCLW